MHIKHSLVLPCADNDNGDVYCIPGPQGDHGKAGEK